MNKPSIQLSTIEFQVLLALSREESYGYAIMKAVEDQTVGRLSPEIGSLYRVLSRMMGKGLVEERPAPGEADANHRGLPRKYYGLTRQGSLAIRDEAAHLAAVVEIARDRDLLPPEAT
jgi:DNA-binding PadR family transcriptional regulator